MSTAVDNLADTLASASITDPTSTANTGNTPAAQNADVIASAAEGRRLYIGNLAYATTEGELKEFFKDYSV
jgi:RNA recognition motif-containing protein